MAYFEVYCCSDRNTGRDLCGIFSINWRGHLHRCARLDFYKIWCFRVLDSVNFIDAKVQIAVAFTYEIEEIGIRLLPICGLFIYSG